MTLLTHELKASYAFIERNFNLTRRYWGWEVAFLVYSVAGALSISLIGADVGDDRLLLSLIVGAVFWNYLSVVFSWIAETISVERWEGTLEYTFMAPIRRWTQLLGSCLYAMVYGLIHIIPMPTKLNEPRSMNSAAVPRCISCSRSCGKNSTSTTRITAIAEDVLAVLRPQRAAILAAADHLIATRRLVREDLVAALRAAGAIEATTTLDDRLAALVAAIDGSTTHG